MTFVVARGMKCQASDQQQQHTAFGIDRNLSCSRTWELHHKVNGDESEFTPYEVPYIAIDPQ